MKHILTHRKIIEYLEAEGPKNTHEIGDYLSSYRSGKTGSKSNKQFNQPIQVLINIMRRKPFCKSGYDAVKRVQIWAIKEE